MTVRRVASATWTRRTGGGSRRHPGRWLAVVVLLAVSGCTGGGSGASDPGDRSGGGGAAPRGGAGGTLAIALLDPGPLDPARAAGLEDEVVLGNLFDGLTTIDPGGAVRPAVAAAWTSDPALRRWEFRLRPDARWADGSRVTAADFVFAWQRLADPEARPGPSPARALLADVTGYRAFATGRSRTIAGLEAPDPAVLRMSLDRPFADLPAAVAALPLSPLPKALVARDPAAYLSWPVGNGPFRLAAQPRPGRPLTLEPNPAHPGPPALLDRVVVHPVPDEQTAWLELQHGRAAFAPVPPDQLAAARIVHGPSPDHRTRPGLLQGPTLTAWHLTFNLKSKPANDPRWRQAVSLAINRQRLATTLSGSPATTLIPPATPGSAAGVTGGGGAGAGACAACVHDPARARALFAAAKAGRDPVRLEVPSGGDARRVAALVADDLAAAGVTVAPGPTEAGEGGTVVTLVRRVAPYPRPAAQFTPTPTPTAYRDPAVDRLLSQAGATPDDPTRAAHYRQAEAAILADLPLTPLFTEHHAAVLTPGVQGFDLTPWGTLDLAAVSVSA